MKSEQEKLKELEKEVKRLKAKLSETRTSQESELKREKVYTFFRT
jgi:tetrahydromethanopterin S-methyltransferase subunit B